MLDIVRGDVVWADLGPARGHEQGGRRPVVVVSSDLFLDVVDTLAIVVPVTSRNRGWSNHIALTGPTGLLQPSWAITEQLMTVSRERLNRISGQVGQDCLEQIRIYLRDFLDL